MRVRLGGVDSLLLASALLISAILRLRVSSSLVDNFAYARSTSLFFCFFPRQPLHFEGVPSLLPAASPPPLFNSSPSLSSLPSSSMLPFHYPPLPALVVAASPIPRRIVDIVATGGRCRHSQGSMQCGPERWAKRVGTCGHMLDIEAQPALVQASASTISRSFSSTVVSWKQLTWHLHLAASKDLLHPFSRIWVI